MQHCAGLGAWASVMLQQVRSEGAVGAGCCDGRALVIGRPASFGTAPKTLTTGAASLCISHSFLCGRLFLARCPLPAALPAARCPLPALPRHHLPSTSRSRRPLPPPSSADALRRPAAADASNSTRPSNSTRSSLAQQPRPTRTLASHAPSPSPPPYAGVKAASLMSVTTVHESQMMSPYAADRAPTTAAAADAPNFSHPHPHTPKGLPHRTPSERSLPLRERAPNASKMNGAAKNPRPAADRRTSHDDARRSRADLDRERDRDRDSHSLRQSTDSRAWSGEPPARDDGYFASVHSSESKDMLGTTHVKLGQLNSFDGAREAQKDFVPDAAAAAATAASLRVPTSTHRVSAPPAFNNDGGSSTATPSPSQHPYRLQQRHTLEVPRLSTARPRDARNSTDDVVTATGRFSPTSASRRRGSMSLVRRTTRSINSDMHLDEVPQDDDAARWAEHIRQKRASKRKRREDEDEDRVVVGTKVDQNHVNWVTAYNMLTGIRFTVSRTNAKMDRELTDADFDAKHKFSFDITGNELTPSAKYDFKFKDYAPWVFRHLRGTFKLDPADYLVSLTSKYILSELGSPGKSGSFFYFSRDYKYIIKTIHHAEHKFLRKILKDYYNHVQENPNTLLSQFYGLHRVKIPYGRKIHFVVMNNLFPPHRDIHRTFDLKGSTIGRDFREEDLEKNPRATLKDLNWLRRDLHLELGPTKKNAFIEQMQKDVKLMQKLHIMDYSMLIGIHDLEKGNEENLREKTLKVFQPGGEAAEEPQPNQLMRTPSKLETARKARELRQSVKTQKPVPMEQTSARMPDELEDSKKNFFFYSDDGGFQATHEDNRPGEEIYYLGIIDCLTHVSFAVVNHKVLTNSRSTLSSSEWSTFSRASPTQNLRFQLFHLNATETASSSSSLA